MHRIEKATSIRCNLPSPSDASLRMHPIEICVCIGWTEKASSCPPNFAQPPQLIPRQFQHPRHSGEGVTYIDAFRHSQLLSPTDSYQGFPLCLLFFIDRIPECADGGNPVLGSCDLTRDGPRRTSPVGEGRLLECENAAVHVIGHDFDFQRIGA